MKLEQQEHLDTTELRENVGIQVLQGQMGVTEEMVHLEEWEPRAKWVHLEHVVQ